MDANRFAVTRATDVCTSFVCERKVYFIVYLTDKSDHVNNRVLFPSVKCY